MAEPITDFTFTQHARGEMERRGVSENAVRQVLLAPEQRERIRQDRDVLQSRVEEGGKEFMVRVFVDVDRSPAEVVTAYKTSKIAKYWRPAK